MHTDALACYAAVLARDAVVDGRFFTCVVTTGIYCRPVCPARPPHLKNCRFVATAGEAVAMGFRACKRCRPESVPGSPAWLGSAASVRRALSLIDRGALDVEGGAVVEGLGDRLGLGARQLRRLFVRHVGAPPVAVAQARRLAVAAELIDAGVMPLGQVALAAGFGSVRRFNELYRSVHGETPASRRRRARKGQAMQLTLSRYDAAVGELLVVTDGDNTLRALDFYDFEARMRTLLGRHYGVVELRDGQAPGVVTAALDAYFAGDLAALESLAIATGGSSFQRNVWAALRAIPAGTTTGYGALAAVLGNPGAARAVGLANGANPIGIVVPCHRVIGASGALTGYAGGVERKRWLLRHEGAI
jgi:AraC family transcriptional regulator of adaptative response/methylated-DNA-[protein]-cysteine methyltransferase